MNETMQATSGSQDPYSIRLFDKAKTAFTIGWLLWFFVSLASFLVTGVTAILLGYRGDPPIWVEIPLESLAYSIFTLAAVASLVFAVYVFFITAIILHQALKDVWGGVIE